MSGLVVAFCFTKHCVGLIVWPALPLQCEACSGQPLRSCARAGAHENIRRGTDDSIVGLGAASWLRSQVPTQRWRTALASVSLVCNGVWLHTEASNIMVEESNVVGQSSHARPATCSPAVSSAGVWLAHRV